MHVGMSCGCHEKALTSSLSDPLSEWRGGFVWGSWGHQRSSPGPDKRHRVGFSQCSKIKPAKCAHIRCTLTLAIQNQNISETIFLHRGKKRGLIGSIQQHFKDESGAWTETVGHSIRTPGTGFVHKCDTVSLALKCVWIYMHSLVWLSQTQAFRKTLRLFKNPTQSLSLSSSLTLTHTHTETAQTFVKQAIFGQAHSFQTGPCTFVQDAIHPLLMKSISATPLDPTSSPKDLPPIYPSLSFLPPSPMSYEWFPPHTKYINL